MKKINFTQFVVSGIYNFVYKGPNQEFARINGKKTFEVIQVNPILKIEILHDKSGSVYTRELRLKNVIIPCPEKAFEEFELYECEDSSEWFIKAVRVSSLDEAIQEGLPVNEIRGKRLSKQSCITRMSDRGSNLFGISYTFRVEDKTTKPLLQAIVVLWKNTEEMYTDIERYGATIG